MSTRALCLLLGWALIGVAAPLTAQKESYDEYTAAIGQAMRLSDEKRLDKAVRDNPVHTTVHYGGLVLSMMRDPNVANEDQRRELEQSWERVYQGRTLDFMNRWLQTLDRSGLRSYDQAQTALAKGYAELDRLKSQRATRKPFETLRDSLMRIAEVFEGIGDPLDAADAWGVIATIYSVIPDRTVADRREGIFAMERFLELRRRWQWTKDDYFQRNEAWMKAEKLTLETEEEEAAKRESEGYGGDVRGVDAYLVADADAQELVGDIKFAVQKKVQPDMCIQGGPVPLLWPSIRVDGSGPVQFLWFKGTDLFFVRPGTNDWGVTLEGGESDMSKNPFVEVTVASKLRKPSRFALDARGERPYAMWFFIGGAQQLFMGINQNFEATRDTAVVFYKSAGRWTAEVDGTVLAFFDDNSNGKLFEDDPFAYGWKDRHVGASPAEEVPIPAFDGMQIGRGPVVPYSQWVEIGGSWYHLRGKEDGTQVGLRPVNPEYFKVGSIQLDWSGSKNNRPALLIVQGRGDFEGARFDISSGKPVEVPAGEYLLQYGRIEQGKGARLITANVFGVDMKPIEVQEGEVTKVELGAPFRLDFNRRGSGRDVEIESVEIRIRGRGGELYTHVNGAVPAPAVMSARGEDGKGAREVGEFVPIRDPDTLNAVAVNHTNLGSHAGFYPIPKGSRGGTVLKVTVPEGYFVGLQEKKNKLFGKLEPIFK